MKVATMPWRCGDTLDRAFQQERMVAGRDRIVGVVQVDLELAGRVFDGRNVGRDVLRRGWCR